MASPIRMLVLDLGGERQPSIPKTLGANMIDMRSAKLSGFRYWTGQDRPQAMSPLKGLSCYRRCLAGLDIMQRASRTPRYPFVVRFAQPRFQYQESYG